jgi:Fic family protein
MFIPHFTITPKITQNIELIGQVFGFFRAIKLPEGYRKELISKITAETVHASTAIEGNTLTEKQVVDVLQGKKIYAQDQDIREIINYNTALSSLEKLVKNKQETVITERLIKQINTYILHDIRNDIAGVYRTGQVRVGDYLPPEYDKVTSLMHEFVQWINDPQPASLSPLLYTGIAHYQFVAIHPFTDGNGRTTRILTTLMLALAGYDMTSFFALESYYFRDKKVYYEALNSADKYRINGEPDLTRWLEYYVEGMLIEATRAQSRIESLQKKSERVYVRIWLSEIQLKILRFTITQEAVKAADYVKIVDLSRKGTYNAVEKLVKEGLLRRKGMNKGAYYTITEKGLEYR